MAFSFFMRDLPTLEHAANHMITHATGRSRIKVWDAGSALGQETYTVAMKSLYKSEDIYICNN